MDVNTYICQICFRFQKRRCARVRHAAHDISHDDAAESLSVCVCNLKKTKSVTRACYWFLFDLDEIQVTPFCQANGERSRQSSRTYWHVSCSPFSVNFVCNELFDFMAFFRFQTTSAASGGFLQTLPTHLIRDTYGLLWWLYPPVARRNASVHASISHSNYHHIMMNDWPVNCITYFVRPPFCVGLWIFCSSAAYN